MEVKSICVYCASNRDAPEKMRKLAREAGAGLARRGITVVYGGASIGLMGELADGALAAGGEVTGVIPEWLTRAEVAHRGLTRLIVTRDMSERKMTMARLADAFMILPGGLGTMEETLEILTLKYLGLHIKPVMALNHEGYFDHLLAQFAHGVEEGLMREGLERLWAPRATLDEIFAMIDGRENG